MLFNEHTFEIEATRVSKENKGQRRTRTQQAIQWDRTEYYFEMRWLKSQAIHCPLPELPVSSSILDGGVLT